MKKLKSWYNNRSQTYITKIREYVSDLYHNIHIVISQYTIAEFGYVYRGISLCISRNLAMYIAEFGYVYRGIWLCGKEVGETGEKPSYLLGFWELEMGGKVRRGGMLFIFSQKKSIMGVGICAFFGDF